MSEKTATAPALWWAQLRRSGPRAIAPGMEVPIPALRLSDGRAQTWVLAHWPEPLRPAVVEEVGSAHLVERPIETAQALAACLKCCWVDPDADPWPGRPTSLAAVISVLTASTHRDAAAAQLAAKRARGQLHRSGWLQWPEGDGPIRLGPRVALWTLSELTELRELLRSLPQPRGPQ